MQNGQQIVEQTLFIRRHVIPLSSVEIRCLADPSQSDSTTRRPSVIETVRATNGATSGIGAR